MPQHIYSTTIRLTTQQTQLKAETEVIMKLLGLLVKLALAFLAFGAAASLYLNKNKEEYITFEQENDLDLY